MKQLLKRKEGVILIEALVAVAVLAIASIVTANLIRGGVDNMLYARNYMIATGLITEATDGLVNIRNSNILRNPDDINQVCLDLINPYQDCGVGSHFAGGNSYVLSGGEDGKWKAVLTGTTLNYGLALEGGKNDEHQEDKYQLWERIATSYWGYYYDEPYDLILKKPTGFYRSIELLPSDDEYDLNFVIRIQWKEGSKVQTLVENFTLHNTIPPVVP